MAPLSQSRQVSCAVEDCGFWLSYNNIRRYGAIKHKELKLDKTPLKKLCMEVEDVDNDFRLDHIESIFLPEDGIGNPTVWATNQLPNGRT